MNCSAETEKIEWNSANEAGDFQSMAVTAHSEQSYFRGLSLIELGRFREAAALFNEFKAFAKSDLKKTAKIDYFATSLPLLLVFEDDLDAVHQRTLQALLELARRGLMQVT